MMRALAAFVFALASLTTAMAEERPDYARFGALAAEAKYCGRQDLAEDLIFAFFGFSGFQAAFKAREARFLALGRRDWQVLCPHAEAEAPLILARYFTHREIPFRELPDNLLPHRALEETLWRGMAQSSAGPAPLLAEARVGEPGRLNLVIGRIRCTGDIAAIPRSDPFKWRFDGECPDRGALSGVLALERSALTAEFSAAKTGETLSLSMIPVD